MSTALFPESDAYDGNPVRPTLSFDGATWADLRKYVALNHAAPDGDPLRFDYDEILGDDAPVGLSEAIPAEEVLPRGE